MTLGLILQKHGIPSVIYERENADTNSRRGGSLDIHEDSADREWFYLFTLHELRWHKKGSNESNGEYVGWKVV